MIAESQLRQEIQVIEARTAREHDHWQQHIRAVEDRSHAQVDQARVDLKTVRSELADVRKQHREDQRMQQQRIVELTQALSRAEREASRQRGVAEALTLKLGRGVARKTQQERTAKTTPRRTRHAGGR